MNSTSIVVLTGAGISAESGIKTFRGNGGLWENYPIEKIATTKGYKRNPKLVLDFYNARRAQVLSPWVRPNAAHLALAQLERTFPDAVTIITQNIDSLHEKGGSENILHMHGDLSKVRCTYCNTIYECYKNIDLESECQDCQSYGKLRPHVVWFGETPLYMDKIYKVLENAQLFISIGTSGDVFPAAGFVEHARDSGAYCLEINIEPTLNSFFHHVRKGLATKEVPKLVTEICSFKNMENKNYDWTKLSKPLRSNLSLI